MTDQLKTLLLALSIGLSSSVCAAMQYPPPGSHPGAVWPATSSLTPWGGYAPDPDYVTVLSTSPLAIEWHPLAADEGSPLDEALKELGKVDPTMESEIRGAIDSGSIKFGALDKDAAVNGATSLVREADDNCPDGPTGGIRIGVKLDGRAAVDVAVTLGHEWKHAREAAGYDDGVPDCSEEMNSPCNHVWIENWELFAYLELAQWHADPANDPDGEGELIFLCWYAATLNDTCEVYLNDCLAHIAAGGSGTLPAPPVCVDLIGSLGLCE